MPSECASLQLVPLARKISHLCYVAFAGFCPAVLSSCSFSAVKENFLKVLDEKHIL